MGTDTVTQTILGTYDSILGTNDQQISGVAIQQGAMQANAAAIPYLMGYIKGLNRIAQIIIDLIPKYYVTPRSLPIMTQDGKRSYQIINHEDNPMSVDLYYNPNSLQVKVEAGVSSGVQKQVALDQIIRMMQSSELFAQFINTMGLETILDNMDIRGIEGLKAQGVQFMKQQQEAQQAQAEAAKNQEDPATAQIQAVQQIEMAKIEQQAQKLEADTSISAAKLANEKELTNIKFMQAMAQIQQNQAELALLQQKTQAGLMESEMKMIMEKEKQDSENARTAIEAAMAVADKMKEHASVEIIE